MTTQDELQDGLDEIRSMVREIRLGVLALVVLQFLPGLRSWLGF
jgi:hypothetical protein